MGREEGERGIEHWVPSWYTLIGLSGKAGAGKNTVADIICDLIPGAEQYALAGPLKQMALAIDPLIPRYGNERLTTVVTREGWDNAKQIPEVRRFLQRLGTEGVRGTFGDDAWVDLMWDWWESSNAHVGVVTDVRYPNERDAVDVTVEVRREGASLAGELAEHLSEAGVTPDLVIENIGDLDLLRDKVRNVLRQLELLPEVESA